MRLRLNARWGLVAVTAIGFLVVSACGTKEPEPGASGPKAAEQRVEPSKLKDEIPGGELAAVLAAHYAGLGHMERYEYREAVEAFRSVQKRAPGWIPGAINLAIALLNDSGVKVEQAKKAGGAPSAANFDEALGLLAGVLKRDANNPYAHFCRGIMLEQLGNIAEAHDHFNRVTEIDPNDAAGWYWMGATLPEATRDAPDPETRMKALKEKSKEEMAYFKKALELNPYLTPAVYRYAMAARLATGMKESSEWFAKWKRMNPDQDPSVAAPGPGDILDKKYGDMGRYGTIVNPLPELGKVETSEVPGPRFEAARPLDVKLAEGERWANYADLRGKAEVTGWARGRFGPGISAFDADGDGKLDIYLTSAVIGASGIRDILLLNKGEGRFTDGSAAFGLAKDRGSIGVAAADFDADKHIDLFLTGVGGNRLLRNIEDKRFEDISAVLKPAGVSALSLMARWVDIDQDGDLDLYVVNYCAAADAEKAASGVVGVVNSVYRNDGEAPADAAAATIQARAPAATAYGRKTEKGLSIALVPWPRAEALLGGTRAHTGMAVLDIDNDRDLDFVLSADKSPLVAILNDRLGAFHEAAIEGVAVNETPAGLLTVHLDADGRADVVAFNGLGQAQAWRNVTERATADKTRIRFESWPIDSDPWTTGQAVDLDLDGRTDLLGDSHLPKKSVHDPESLAEWSRNDGRRFVKGWLEQPVEASRTTSGVLAADLVGDPLPDILRLGPGEGPVLARNLGNGQHWVSLKLGGYWRVKPEFMRTNPHGIGTRVTLEGQGLFVPYDHTTPESGLGQSVAPIVLGMGASQHADLVHLRWPDGVMQCELSQAADQMVDMAENNRKTGSCPVLFTWDGKRYVCIGDFLGGGGMGYLVAPGVYSQPDRDEAMAITAEQLRESEGVYRLSITEPMDEIAYLDHLRLDVVDRPPGVSSTPDERFAPEGPRPTGEVIAWRRAVEAKRATDLSGRDVTETLRFWDRRTVDGFRKLKGWIGYAEEHGIVLDFGGRLSGYGAGDPLVLCLAGWVEYPYSQTNYAAATAGVTLRAPVIERLEADGLWKAIEPNAGYPAGLPRMMTVDLTGKLSGARCVLRIRTNMECYYDQAFIAVRDRAAEKAVRVKSLGVARAVLGYRGYTREVSPDGEQPLLYDYDHVDPAPLARLSGKLTRFGDVAALLQKDDDQLCLVGPGDEVRVEFAAGEVPELASGWTRSYVLRSFGYCKDADPFTAGGDSVEPLPWRGMPAYPFAGDVRRPSDAGYELYLRTYQTRAAGGEHP